MKKIIAFISIFLLWTLAGMLMKVPFMCLYCTSAIDSGAADALDVLQHGLCLDLAVAGYLTLLPLLLMAVSVWGGGRWLRWLWRAYFAVASVLAILAYVSNLALYEYWGFPLDSTPILYITTSPGDALASMTVGQMILLPLAIAVLSIVLYMLFMRLTRHALDPIRMPWHGKALLTLLLLVLDAALILPIRGGVSTGVNHTGNVYFSTDMRLNHAAVNPVFCFVESATHTKDISSEYRFMPSDEAERIVRQMTCTRLRPNAVERRPNVIIICLEGFSKYIMAEAGHVRDVTPNLDRLRRDGICFTNFYANSFRTDRALVSILSGLPAQPTMSVMSLPQRSTRLPGIARSLRREGYATQFYYGGDTGFSNMQSWLVGTGFETITSEKDFPAALRTNKWGVADGPVYARMLDDIVKHEAAQRQSDKATPFFKVIMTESSHEPFDVPYSSSLPPELNAFKYADMCLGDFIKQLRQTTAWHNTLVVILPDHLGAYPTKIDNYQLWRYEIPLILTGGAATPSLLPPDGDLRTIGCQSDLAATLLALLGIDHSDFPFSRDMLDAAAPHSAFFAFPDAMGLLTPAGYVLYDNTSGTPHTQRGDATTVETQAKAWLQRVYDYLAE